jgi:2-keto-4-pentenoate hydratase/2-oxohepta-3-ene-1,7-dioic acid hydratase in catechol pathway
MAFSVPVTLPALPPYGLPPNVIRASYALNLIQTDAYQFATSRRKIANFFLVAPLPVGTPATLATFAYLPLPTANGQVRFIGYGENVKVTISSLTSAVSTLVSVGAPDIFSGTLSGVTSGLQEMQVEVDDQGGGSLAALFLFEASLTAGQLP